MFSSKSYLVATLLGFAVFVVATATSAQNSAANNESRIRGLLIEKRDALASKLAMAEEFYRQGTSQFGAVLDAKMDLLDAKLALAESAAGRITILEERLGNRRSNESRLEAQHKVGAASFAEKVDATVQRIDAEIALMGETKEN